MNMLKCIGIDWSEQPESQCTVNVVPDSQLLPNANLMKNQEVIFNFFVFAECVSIGEWQLHPGGGHRGRDHQREQGERTLNLCRNHRSSRSWKIRKTNSLPMIPSCDWLELILCRPIRETYCNAGLCRLSGVPDLPEARGKLCAAYDPSGALIGNTKSQCIATPGIKKKITEFTYLYNHL